MGHPGDLIKPWQLINPEDGDNCAVDNRLEDCDAVTLGVDGGKPDDATAQVAVERFVAAVEHRQVRHRGETAPKGRTLRRHVLNASRRPNRYGLSFVKPNRESPTRSTPMPQHCWPTWPGIGSSNPESPGPPNARGRLLVGPFYFFWIEAERRYRYLLGHSLLEVPPFPAQLPR